MNRLGWMLLALFLLIIAGFFLLVEKQDGAVQRPPTPTSADQLPPSRQMAPLAAGQRHGTQAASGLIIPVAGVRADQLTDSFSDPRGGGARDHQAIDILAPRGTPVIAAAPGTVEKIFESVPGGHTVYVRSADGRTVFYYAHLDGYAPALAEGVTLDRGDAIGMVGSSGNADPATPHLHFEVHRMAEGEDWYQGTAVNPYPLLVGAAAGG